MDTGRHLGDVTEVEVNIKIKPPQRAISPTSSELYKLLLASERLQASEKFLAWRPKGDEYEVEFVKTRREFGPDDLATYKDAAERHWSVAEVADQWGVSPQTIRNVFDGEPGVLRIPSQSGDSKKKRDYTTVRIPQSVMERVYNRLTATPQVR
jgi:hypothetical protein